MLDITLVVVMSRVRPDAADQPPLRPRPLVEGVVGGAGAAAAIKGGAVVGKTNANGTAVTDREVNGGHLFHTYLRGARPGPDEELLPDDRPDPDGRPEGQRRSRRCWHEPFAWSRASRPDQGETRPARWKHASPLIGCRFDPSGRSCSPCPGRTLQRFDLSPGKAAFAGHASWVRGMAFVPRRRGHHSAAVTPTYSDWPAGWALGGAAQATAVHARLGRLPRQADLVGRRRRRAAAAASSGCSPRGWVRAVAVSPDGKTLASCGNDHLVKLWSAADGKPFGR